MTDPMDGDWARLDESPAASAQMIQWHAPETYAVIRGAVRAEASAEVTAIVKHGLELSAPKDAS